MAEIRTLISDLTRSLGTDDDPVGTYPFDWEGQPLEIDLLASEYAQWGETLAPLLAAARPRTQPKTRTRRTAEATTEGSRAKRWARDQHGVDLAMRGPCPDVVLQAYKQDNPALLGDLLPNPAPDTP